MIKIAKGFCDLCIPYNEKRSVMMEIFQELIENGYKNVAIEQIYTHESLSSKNGKDLIPEPVKLIDFQNELGGKLKLFNRLTIVYSDPSISHACGRSQNFKKYHLVAALPTTEAAFQHSCQTFQGDIITYNFDTVRIRISRKFYYLALRRNIFFELKYTPTILDSSERRATINKAQQYHMVGKSRGIIISSEARDKFHIRSPLDVACLGFIFGLSDEQGRASLSSVSKKVLLSAECRRLGRTPVLIKYEDVDTTTTEEESDMEIDTLSSQDLNKRKLVNSQAEMNKKPKVS